MKALRAAEFSCEFGAGQSQLATRYSVGIEDAADLIADLAAALERA